MNIEHYRQRLLELERELSARLERTIANAREQVDESARDAGDESVTDELKDESLKEAELDSTMLLQVRGALERIANGTFGRCIIDGGPIEEKRLEAMPWTPYCLKHQEELESGQLPAKSVTL